MKTKINVQFFLCFLFLISIYHNISGQLKSTNFEKAKFITGDVNSYFFKTMKYPQNAKQNTEFVNVVLSFIIDKNGKVDSIKVLKQPHILFTQETLIALNNSSGMWIPSKIDGKPVDKKYIGNFKFATSTAPTDYKERGLRLFKKGDFEKALKVINTAIKYNPYDKELYEARSKIYMNLKKIDQTNIDIEKLDSINTYLLIDVGFAMIKNPM